MRVPGPRTATTWLAAITVTPLGLAKPSTGRGPGPPTDGFCITVHQQTSKASPLMPSVPSFIGMKNAIFGRAPMRSEERLEGKSGERGGGGVVEEESVGLR